jgi:hypothetical protein
MDAFAMGMAFERKQSWSKLRQQRELFSWARVGCVVIPSKVEESLTISENQEISPLSVEMTVG